MLAFLTGSASLYRSVIYPKSPNSPPNIVQGGPLLPQGAQMSVTLDPNKCTYSFWVRAGITAKDNQGNSLSDNAGFMQSANRPLSNNDTELSGSAQFPAHSIVFNNGGDFYEAELVKSIAGENGAGTAQVSWSFTPAP
jgi:hypothetical protein